jgi:hypothetical protein
VTAIDGAQAEAIAAAAKSELARRHLIPFAKRLIPEYQAPRHVEHLADLLESIERGDQRRLLVTLFPGNLTVQGDQRVRDAREDVVERVCATAVRLR